MSESEDSLFFDINEWRKEVDRLEGAKLAKLRRVNSFATIREFGGNLVDSERVINIQRAELADYLNHLLRHANPDRWGPHLYSSLKGATCSAVLENLSRHHSKYHGTYYEAPTAEYFAYARMAYAPGLLVRLNGISLSEFLEASKGGQLPLSKGYEFLVEATSIVLTEDYDQKLAYNQDEILAPYPNYTKYALFEGSHLVRALASSDPAGTLIRYPNLTRNIREIVPAHMKDMLKTVHATLDQIFAAVTDPDSPDFPAIKERLEKYLEHPDRNVRREALLRLGLTNIERCFDMFRKARTNATEGKEVAFYSRLESEIAGLIEEVPDLASSSRDDLEAIIRPEQIDESDDLDQEQVLATLSIRVNEILSRSSNPEYNVDPISLIKSNPGLKGLIPPDSLTVEFDQKNKRDVSIFVTWGDEEDSLALALGVEVSKNPKFDWTFLEPVDDPSMKQMSQVAYRLVEAALNDVLRQATAIQQQRLSKRTGVTKVPTAASKGNILEIREKLQREGDEDESHVEESQDEVESMVRTYQRRIDENKIARAIVYSDLADKSEGITAQDLKIVEQAIIDYNERGVGRFKRLSTIIAKGAPRYELKVWGLTQPIRVVLSEEGSVKGNRRFIVQAVGPRRDIFRRHKISSNTL